MIYSTFAWAGSSSLAYGQSTGVTTNSATTDASDSSATATGRASTLMQASTKAALDKAAHGFKATQAAKSLTHDATQLGTDLRSALSSAGISLQGSVEFSVDSKGALQVTGNDHDKAAVMSFLQGATGGAADLRNRLTRLTTSAGQLSQQIRQSAAASQAARTASSSGNVMSLYSTFLQQQSATPASFTLSASSASLSYPGMLTAQA